MPKINIKQIDFLLNEVTSLKKIKSISIKKIAYIEKNKEAIYKKHNEKIKCHCGGHYTKQQRVRHFKTATHILNDPVYTKHRLENLMAYQHIEYLARKHPQIAEHQITKCCCGGHYRHRFREVHLRTNEHLNFVKNAQNV